MKRQVSNLINDRGNAAANQFVIIENTKSGTKEVFQSYETRVAYVRDRKVCILPEALEPRCTDSPSSVTTRKHLYIFLRDYAGLSVHSIKDLKAFVKSGRITVTSRI